MPDAQQDARRSIPRTDEVLADARLTPLVAARGRALVKDAVVRAQHEAREGRLAPQDVVDRAAALVPPLTRLTPVLNATGIVVHTNIGRAPLSDAARQAMAGAAGTLDLEMSLESGHRSRRGGSAEDAVLAALDPEVHGPDVRADLGALLVNNGAAALVLATTALAAGREVVISRGEFVEIGAGFRLSDLMESTGARLREVGTTNRTHPADYARALGEATGCVLKVHPSNFRVEGFTGGVEVAQLARLLAEAGESISGAQERVSDRRAGGPVPLVVDVGSGLLRHDPTLPAEPDVSSALRDGADLVLCSGDKLLGGPQAGVLVGRTHLVEKLRRFPLARAVRVDKITLAALEATLRGPEPPVTRFRRLRPANLRGRTAALAERVGGTVVASVGHVGGGGAPGVPLPGLAVALPQPGNDAPLPAGPGRADALAHALRTGTPAVLARVAEGTCLVDLRCVEPRDDDALAGAVTRALTACGGATAGAAATATAGTVVPSLPGETP